LGLEAKVPNWTQSDTCLLKQSYRSVALQTIARELDRTPKATAKKARQMGLVRYRYWSQQETQTLEALWASCSVYELADRFGRSPDSIRHKAKQLRLREKTTVADASGPAFGSQAKIYGR